MPQGIYIGPSGDLSGDTDTNRLNSLAAARIAVQLGGDTYYLKSVQLPQGAVIKTQGEATVLQQVSNVPVGTCMLNIVGSYVQLGMCTVRGNLDPLGTDEQNHAVKVRPISGDIQDIRLGGFVGQNIRGDIVYVGGLNNAKVRGVHCGPITGDNIYRNPVSITGGEDIDFSSICVPRAGYMQLCVEPNPNSQICSGIRVRYIKGGRVGVVAAGSLINQDVSIGSLDLNPSYQVNATVPYSRYDMSSGLDIRNTFGLKIGRYAARDFAFHAVRGIKDPTDQYSRNIVFDQVDWANCSVSDVQSNTYALASAAIRSMDILGGQILLGPSKSAVMGNSSDASAFLLRMSGVTVNGTLARYCGHSTFDRIEVDATANDQYLLLNCDFPKLIGSKVKLGRLFGYSSNTHVENSVVDAPTLYNNCTGNKVERNSRLNGINYP